jgi:prolyl 4-hydroxylase
MNETSRLGLNVTVLSRPYVEGKEGILGQALEEGQIEGPWVVAFENFLSNEEADRMIELGLQQGYERSADVGAMKFDGTLDAIVNDGRTSTNAWCTDGCEEDPISRDIWKRIEQLTGIPEKNSEHFQILRYEEGQFYNVHHDYIPEDADRPNGVRILTFFMYLSDVVEGGGTNFPRIGDPPGLTVVPKKGRAVLWPNVLNDEPSEWDPRTHHAALPVLKGLKYACNAWIHMRDFKTPHSQGCS